MNDKTPTFIDGDHMTILVSENISGPYPIKLGAATAIDDDPGFNGTISYAIIHVLFKFRFGFLWMYIFK